MGCDIHIWAEVREDNGKWERFIKEHFSKDEWSQKYDKREKDAEPFNWRDYSIFGFLAGVRNYSESEVLVEPRGLPKDSEYLNKTIKGNWSDTTEKAEMEECYHNCSFITLKELLDFDYDKKFWNRRIIRYNDGAARANQGEGEIISYRDHLGEMFFKHLSELSELGRPEDVRIVFGFDS